MSRPQFPFATNTDYTVHHIGMDNFVNSAPRQRSDTVTAGEKTSLVTERVIIDTSGGSLSTGLAHPSNSYHGDSQQCKMEQPVSDRFGKKFTISCVIRYLAVVLLIGVPLSIPVIVFRDYAVVSDLTLAPSKQYHNLVFYLFAWLLNTWLCAVVSNVFIRSFPHLFRFVSGRVNPAHRKYWRVFRALRNPVTFVGCVLGSLISFAALINSNSYLIINYNKDLANETWDDVLNVILFICTLWAFIYLIEKVIVLYISIHYHYRSDFDRIKRSKAMQGALSALYEASLQLYPAYQEPFSTEDYIIRHFTALDEGNPTNGAGQFLRKLGMVGDKVTDILGHVLNSGDKSHWFNPDAPYAIVGHALEHPRSAAALATRIWQSMVREGNDKLTVDDIAEVLGPHHREDAEKYFKVLDENENKDIELDELVMTVVELGRIRHAIFQGMNDINHAINTFDWIALIAIGFFMIFFIMVLYVPVIMTIKETVGFAALGISFALGRTVHEFLSGCIFLFFKHAYDIGDRVEVYNMAGTTSVSATVTRISVLYTVFKRIDNGKDLQISNDRLNLKRIENVTRSGPNKEAISIFVDFNTTFTDIQYLKQDLQNFVSHRSNSRDFLPTITLRPVNIYEMNKMELKVAFTHKSNWSNEAVRGARSSKFLCALLAAVRKIPIGRPGASDLPVGHEGKPQYHVAIGEEEAVKKVDGWKHKVLAKRMDFVKEEKPKDQEVKFDHAATYLNLTEDEEREQYAMEIKMAEETSAAAAEQAKKAAKLATDKEAEENAYASLTAVPVVPGVSGEAGRGSGMDVEQYGVGVRRGARGLRRVSGREGGRSDLSGGLMGWVRS